MRGPSSVVAGFRLLGEGVLSRGLVQVQGLVGLWGSELGEDAKVELDRARLVAVLVVQEPVACCVAALRLLGEGVQGLV